MASRKRPFPRRQKQMDDSPSPKPPNKMHCSVLDSDGDAETLPPLNIPDTTTGPIPAPTQIAFEDSQFDQENMQPTQTQDVPLFTDIPSSQVELASAPGSAEMSDSIPAPADNQARPATPQPLANDAPPTPLSTFVPRIPLATMQTPAAAARDSKLIPPGSTKPLKAGVAVLESARGAPCACCRCDLTISALRNEVAALHSTLGKLSACRMDDLRARQGPAGSRATSVEKDSKDDVRGDTQVVTALRACLDEAKADAARWRQESEAAYFKLCALARAYHNLERDMHAAQQDAIEARGELSTVRARGDEAAERVKAEANAAAESERIARGEIVAASRRHEARIVTFQGEMARVRAAHRETDREAEMRLREAVERTQACEGRERDATKRIKALEEDSHKKNAELERLRQITQIIRNVTAENAKVDL